MFKLAWWKDESNVKGANAIVGFLKVVVPLVAVAGLTVAGWFGYQFQQKPKSSPPPAASAPAPAPAPTSVTTITADNGGAVQTGSGTQVVTGNNSSVTIGFSEAAFFAQLNQREAQLRADLGRANEAERNLLERQLTAVSAQKEDVDAAYQTAVAQLEELRVKLARFEGQVGQARLSAAQDAIGAGDRQVADQVLSVVAESSNTDAALAAEAAYARGEIAEQEIRWADAAKHYARAAELDPSFDNLKKARELAWLSGDFDASVQLGERLLAVARDGGTQKQLGIALNDYGLSLNAVKRVEESKALFEEAVELTAGTLGEMHPDYATYLSNLGEAHHDLGNLTKAEELYRKTLEIDRETIGVESADYAINLQSLADLLDDMGRFAEAKVFYEEAYNVRRDFVGQDHPDFAESLSAMAYVYWEAGEIDKARSYHTRAVELADSVLGPDHPTSLWIREDHDAFIAEEGE